MLENLLMVISLKGHTIKEIKELLIPKDIAEVIVMANGTKVVVSQMLTHLCFAKTQHTLPKTMEEKRRLYLLMVLMKNLTFNIMSLQTI